MLPSLNTEELQSFQGHPLHQLCQQNSQTTSTFCPHTVHTVSVFSGIWRKPQTQPWL